MTIQQNIFHKALLYLVSGIQSKDFYGILAGVVKRPLFHIIYGKRSKPRILYALTPPARLTNLGDHAQVYAIKKWLKKNYPGHEIIEINKDECYYMIPALLSIIMPDDLIFLHSGGNLGDRGMWSENARRKIIQAFPNNRIISLPQTISFTDTDKGHQEKKISKEIYGNHKDLVIMARDKSSEEIALQIFDKAKILACPDFVLSLPYKKQPPKESTKRKILFCLRNDTESVLKGLKDDLSSKISYDKEFFDTTIERLICPKFRELYLSKTLEYFAQFDAVITDRFHGLIFTYLVGKPCLVLPTVDHKLSSVVSDWFAEVNSVNYCENIENLALELEKLLSLDTYSGENFIDKYFKYLKEKIL